MSERNCVEFELSNVGQGVDIVQPGDLVADGGYLLVVLLDSHYCSQSRELVRKLCSHRDAFRRRSATVVPVLPDIRERGRVWDEQYDLPFPMLVDPGEDSEEPGSTDSFGAFGPLAESVSGTPAFALCDGAGARLDVLAVESEAGLDVPLVDSLVSFVDSYRTTEATPAGNTPVDS